ncbi:hypothetical protein AB0I34_10570 [Kribbella sp. NPDC050281]
MVPPLAVIAVSAAVRGAPGGTSTAKCAPPAATALVAGVDG